MLLNVIIPEVTGISTYKEEPKVARRSLIIIVVIIIILFDGLNRSRWPSSPCRKGLRSGWLVDVISTYIFKAANLRMETYIRGGRIGRWGWRIECSRECAIRSNNSCGGREKGNDSSRGTRKLKGPRRGDGTLGRGRRLGRVEDNLGLRRAPHRHGTRRRRETKRQDGRAGG